jgi:hypothetical protein
MGGGRKRSTVVAPRVDHRRNRVREDRAGVGKQGATIAQWRFDRC